MAVVARSVFSVTAGALTGVWAGAGAAPMHAAMAASINSLLSMKLPPDFCGTQMEG
jgi:hypothetical protein